ncbi:MAG: ABC transporter ATP-binding protein [Oscillospiraceae bacterium]|nr:ABC transporter ATP-binding protein [Oscillospiraceae bacterium]
MRLEVKNLCYSYDESNAIKDVSFSVARGEFVGIIGPNGGGKSTVLKNVYRALNPDRGEILLDNENVHKMPYKKSARKMAVVGQENDLPFDFTVEEIVAMGRSPQKRLFDIDTAQDRHMVHHALEHLGLENSHKRSYQSLSGGEKQRVILARAVCSECDFFVLDEPTNHLDISYQLEIFDFIKRLNITVLAAIHDLNMAALYCDRLYVMKGGEIVLSGTPEEVLTPENIFDIYGVYSKVTKNPENGKLSISYFSGHSKKGT